MANHQPQSAGNGPPSAGIGIQHGQGGQGAAPATQNMSSQNLNQIVRSPSSHVFMFSAIIYYCSDCSSDCTCAHSRGT